MNFLRLFDSFPFPRKFLAPAKIYKNNRVICNSNFIYGARSDLKTEGRTGPEVKAKRPIMKDTYWRYSSGKYYYDHYGGSTQHRICYSRNLPDKRGTSFLTVLTYLR